jgi:hypothetical protein
MLQNCLPKVNPTTVIYNPHVPQNWNIPGTLELSGRRLALGEFIGKCAKREPVLKCWLN